MVQRERKMSTLFIQNMENTYHGTTIRVRNNVNSPRVVEIVPCTQFAMNNGHSYLVYFFVGSLRCTVLVRLSSVGVGSSGVDASTSVRMP